MIDDEHLFKLLDSLLQKQELVDGLGNRLAFMLSSGNDHDCVHAVSLLSQVNIERSNILGDKAYGAKAIL